MENRKNWIDYLRVISMIAVVIIHVTSNTIETFHLSSDVPLMIYQILNGLMRFSVTTFVIISGMLFLNKEKQITFQKMIKKYCFRIFLVIIIVGGFFSFLELFFNTRTLSISMLIDIPLMLIKGETWAHMWYLYLILGIYLITPFIKVLTDNLTKKNYEYLLMILFVFLFVIPFINMIFNIQIFFSIPINSVYIFYYLFGGYIITYNVTKKYRNASLFLLILTTILVILDNLFKWNIFLTTYESIFTLFITNGITMLFLNKKMPENKFLLSLSNCSFGIYLFHQFYINIIYKVLKIDLILDFPFIGLIIYSLIIIGVTYITILILKKNKTINKFI